MNATEIETGQQDVIQRIHLAEAIATALLARASDASPDSDARLRGMVPLLSEYTQKLQEYATDAAMRKGSLPNLSRTGLSQLLPVAKKFAQFVSQRVNRITDDLLRMEIELRLAEYEAALSAAQRS